ncbi:hypothetical protein GCM10010377_08350 [Streptomyces viridiviolaceus]|nr:hypothetical protein GCM10010377_08350 [Streptomyces viridiviolaceus]
MIASVTRALRNEAFLRVEKGHAEPEELAAVTAVLLARAAARPESPSPGGSRVRTASRWHRPERHPGFRAPHSWQV